MLLANAQVRTDIGLRVIAERASGEAVTDLPARAAEAMIADTWSTDLSSVLAGLRASLVTSSPALQARLLQRLLGAQAELAEALRQAYLQELDQVDAAALVGAVTGAIGAAGLACLRQGGTADQIRDAMRRAVDLAVQRR